MNVNYKEIGIRIRKYRKELKMTQQQLADKIGRVESSIRKYEKGEVEIPVSVLDSLASVFNITLTELLGWSYNFTMPTIINKFRNALGMTLEQLSTMTKIDMELLEEYANGVTLPNFEDLKKIASAFGLPGVDALTLPIEYMIEESQSIIENLEINPNVQKIYPMKQNVLLNDFRNILFNIRVLDLTEAMEISNDILSNVIYNNEFITYTKFLIERSKNDIKNNADKEQD
ncbi:MAG TPA: hypothetical protein DC000_03525 [Clostridiales bacterium]|nr:hypothetical protein [Clostridiales bacterium]